MIIGAFAWILWVIRPKIGNKATIGLLFMIILFHFISEGASFYFNYISIKVFIAPVIIASSLVLP